MSIFPLIYLIAIIAVNMMWRGLWGLMDEYILPDRPKLSNWVTFIVGIVIMTVFLLAFH